MCCRMHLKSACGAIILYFTLWNYKHYSKTSVWRILSSSDALYWWYQFYIWHLPEEPRFSMTQEKTMYYTLHPSEMKYIVHEPEGCVYVLQVACFKWNCMTLHRRLAVNNSFSGIGCVLKISRGWENKNLLKNPWLWNASYTQFRWKNKMTDNGGTKMLKYLKQCEYKHILSNFETIR